MGHIACKLDLLEGTELPWVLQLDLQKARCEAELVYALQLSGMRDLIEEWNAMSINADVHENAVLWMHLRLPDSYKTAKGHY